MRILVDTSPWSLALSRSSGVVNQEAPLLKTLIEEGEDIYLLGIILLKKHRPFLLAPRAGLPSFHSG